MFAFSVALWALILTDTYTANLASLLVEDQFLIVASQHIITTIEKAVVYKYPICTYEGTNSDSYLQEVHPDAAHKPKKTLEEMYEAVHNGECDYAVEVIQQWLSNQHQQEFNPDCDLEWIGNGKVVTASATGFTTSTDAGYKCTGLIRDVINIYMEEMVHDGFLKEAWEVENTRSKDWDCQAYNPEQF